MNRLAVLCAALAACAAPSDAVVTDETGSPPSHDHPSDDPMNESDLRAFIDFGSTDATCDITGAAFTVRASDGDTPVTNFACLVEFDDGSTTDACEGEHEFAEAGIHSVRATVTDLDTGRTATAEATNNVRPAMDIDLVLQAPPCGLEFSFEMLRSDGEIRVITVGPPEDVVGENRIVNGPRTGTFQVTRAGIYEVELFVEDERGAATQICTDTVVEKVEVTACPPPPCDPHEAPHDKLN
jgi:PKD repeat protein